MVPREIVFRSLAASGAVLVAFIGVCHEVVGPRLYPWAPALFGGLTGFYVAGAVMIFVGLLLLGGVLEFVRLPVVFMGVATGVVGGGVTILTAALQDIFHLFAFTMMLAGVATAEGYRRAKRGGYTRNLP